MTSNQMRLRGAFFGVSALVLAILWVIYIVEMLTSPWVWFCASCAELVSLYWPLFV
ncbi:MAG: hypothetical protein WBX95_12435 [Xanthobacteraceae bacterium]